MLCLSFISKIARCSHKKDSQKDSQKSGGCFKGGALKGARLLCVAMLACGTVSCTKEAEVFKATESTVKEIVDNQLKEKNWHDELESPKDYELKLTEIDAPLPAASLAVLPLKGVYPEYKDFGSLDVSALEGKLLKMLDSFFEKSAIAAPGRRTVDAECLDPSYPFLSYVMQPYFDKLPAVRYVLYGKPSFLEGCIEIPARLEGDKNHTDLLIYVLKDKEVWYIEQVIFGELINE